jgi:hypothetical protein
MPFERSLVAWNMDGPYELVTTALAAVNSEFTASTDGDRAQCGYFRDLFTGGCEKAQRARSTAAPASKRRADAFSFDTVRLLRCPTRCPKRIPDDAQTKSAEVKL